MVDAADAAAALAEADMIFEGVPETLEAKREALAEIAPPLPPDAMVASTTWSILVDRARAAARAARALPQPALAQPGLPDPGGRAERAAGTRPSGERSAGAMLEGIGKLPVVCGVAPGYIVPRLQALIMNEAARMIEEGVASAEEIDRATAYGLGLRFAAIGVVEFIDFGGADISLLCRPIWRKRSTPSATRRRRRSRR